MQFFFPFVKDYEPNQNFKLSFVSFKLPFNCMPCFSNNGHVFGMIFEYFHDYFHGFCQGFPTIILVFFSYYMWKYSSRDCACLQSGPSFSHGQAIQQDVSNSHGRSIILLYQLHIMLLIQEYIFSTLIPPPIQNHDERKM